MTCEPNHVLIHFLFWLVGILSVLVVWSIANFVRVMREDQ